MFESRDVAFAASGSTCCLSNPGLRLFVLLLSGADTVFVVLELFMFIRVLPCTVHAVPYGLLTSSNCADRKGLANTDNASVDAGSRQQEK